VTVREIGALLRTRKTSCVEFLQQTYREIKTRDSFNSFITLTPDVALAEAAERDRELAEGMDRGPFHGIPIAVKDIFCTQRILTTAGSLVFGDFVPDHNATVVSRLHIAGAISIGKTNLHELAYGITSKNPHYGFVLNPIDPTRIPGGSSGGSAAAVAAGFVPVALGSDTGGSIRIPASFCGVTGLKPTYGRVSRYGVLPLAFSLDHMGPLGSCVEDCALAMNAIAGPDPLDPSCAPISVPDFNLLPRTDLKGLRVGIPRNFFFDRVDEQVSAAVHKSVSLMQTLGALIQDVAIPDLNAVNTAARIIQMAEVAALYAGRHDAALFGSDVWALIQQGKLIAGHEYVNAQRLRSLFCEEFNELWRVIDVLAAPTTPVAAPGLHETEVQIAGEWENTRMASTRLVRAINYLGNPALSMPCGTTVSGLPIGLQLIGAPFSEPKLLQVARTLEPVLRNGHCH
jgi:aspartyl-tRNA(Asn)/glutamyl-tRNA(Gln) amidotransferase subunit A